MSVIETRERLLETALELIWQSNYSSVGVNEICKQAGVTKGILDNSMVARLEFQANYLAGCLLIPKKQLEKEYLRIYSELGLVQRGIFWIYLDNQPINKLAAHNVISKLARYFDVSKSVVRIRLIGFGLLHDMRIKVI